MTDMSEKLDAIGRAFEEFKAKNDTVIAAEIKGATADVVRKDEVDRINAAISNLEADVKAAHRSALFGKLEGEQDPKRAEYKTAFMRWVREGTDEAKTELKNLTTTTGSQGGFAVPEEIDRSILDLIKQISPVRAVANVVQVSTPDYKKLVNVRGTGSGWVGETATRPTTTAPALAEVAPPVGEIYANIAATQVMLDDVFFNVEAWISSEIATEFAVQEAIAFISGDGTNKPRGFLSGTINISGDGTRTFGHLQRLLAGLAGGFIAPTTTASPADVFIDTVHSLKAELRPGASWMMNSLTQAAVRKFKTVDGDYIWRPGLAENMPSTILGFPVYEAAAMPAVATNTDPIAFGNWQRGYTIVDRVGTGVNLRDPFTNKPFVQFYVTKRVGGAVIDSEAIKLIATRTVN